LDPNAVLPKQAKENDAGYDLVALEDGVYDDDNRYIQYRTGIAIQPPEGYHTEIFPRSSISKYDLMLANSIGVIDEFYNGEILLRFKIIARTFGREVCNSTDPKIYKKGDKIGQLLIKKTIIAEFQEVDELKLTQRGAGGFGSTGS